MSKTFWSLTGLTASLLASTAIAQTSTPGGDSTTASALDSWSHDGAWYLGAKVGGNWIGQDTRIRDSNLGEPIDGSVRYDDGYIGAIQGGYAFDTGLRLELEGAARSNDAEAFSGYGRGRGSMRNYAAMVNALYDIPLDTALKPYIGVGVGGADYNPDHVRGEYMPYPSYYSGDKWSPAFQAIAGVAYNLDDNIALTLEYRYFNEPNAYSYPIHTDYEAHSGLIGVRYSFGEPAQPISRPAAYVPPPAQPPAPSAAPRNYLVFFDFNRSDLTPGARGIVDKAAQNTKIANVTRLEVTGYTDTVGSDAYNLRLSRRRAESVASELESQGVPADQIAVFAKGKHDLLVPTADGVREPQNRRVQIVYSAGAGPNS